MILSLYLAEFSVVDWVPYILQRWPVKLICFIVSLGTHVFKCRPCVSIHCSYCFLWCWDFFHLWPVGAFFLSCFPSSDKTMSPEVIDRFLAFWKGKISKLGNRNIFQRENTLWVYIDIFNSKFQIVRLCLTSLIFILHLFLWCWKSWFLMIVALLLFALSYYIYLIIYILEKQCPNIIIIVICCFRYISLETHRWITVFSKH